MASLAEMERELIIERTCAGLEAARRLGHKGGRKRQMADSKIGSAKKLLANGVPPREVAKTLPSTGGFLPLPSLNVSLFLRRPRLRRRPRREP